LRQAATESYRFFAAEKVRSVQFAVIHRPAPVAGISGRLKAPVIARGPSSAGYRLMGGRLAATAHRPPGLFLYQDAHGPRLEVFARPMWLRQCTRIAEQAYGGSEGSDLSGEAWADNGMGYGLVGTSSQALDPLAEEVRCQARTERLGA
jgi:anti-sigma factor RsiW